MLGGVVVVVVVGSGGGGGWLLVVGGGWWCGGVVGRGGRGGVVVVWAVFVVWSAAHEVGVPFRAILRRGRPGRVIRGVVGVCVHSWWL